MEDTNMVSEGELDTTDCHKDRRNMSILKSQEGEIILIDNVNFAIQYKGEGQSLLPCNLPDSLKKPGTKITFSGIVKETRLNEMWAGQPFVLTEIRKLS